MQMILKKLSDVMKSKVSYVLYFALSFISCVSCSVKENRGRCPCSLALDFSEVDTASVKTIDFYIREMNELLLNDVVESEEFSEYYLAYVPRTGLQFSAWSGRGDAFTEALEIPYGEDCPPVYIHFSLINAVNESVTETVVMRKNFCRMTLNVRMTVQSPVSLSVSGFVDGYDADGTPSPGDFMVKVYPEGNDSFCINLPRQMDDSLVMELDMGDKVIKKFPLGQYIAESGYDWTSPDLEDITIDLDFAVTHLSMMIQGWEKEYKFDVVI